MKRPLLIATAALLLLLAGCATTIRSDVTTFHQWPAQMADKTYVFEAPPAAEDTLELHSYQNLVRAELDRLGFHEASGKPALTVSLHFMTTDIPVRVVELSYPMTYSHFGYWRPYWHGWYRPYYDPFWMGSPDWTERTVHNYQREVKVSIKSLADHKRLFDVTVRNTSRQMSTPEMMPALVHSAFADFPGPSGTARTIELKKEG
ncbi:MAG: DUF4136 domain-containing protein [Pseudomonadota bacterium]